jgi:hypothetical protein
MSSSLLSCCHLLTYNNPDIRSYHSLYTNISYIVPSREPSNNSNTMADITKDDLQVEQTEGFKVGEQKTIDEYQKLGE